MRPFDIVTAIRICDEFHLRFTLDHVTSGTDILEFCANVRRSLLVGPSLGSRGKVELHGKGFDSVAALAEGRDICIITDAPVIPPAVFAPVLGLAIGKGMAYEKSSLQRSPSMRPASWALDQRVGSPEKKERMPFGPFQG